MKTWLAAFVIATVLAPLNIQSQPPAAQPGKPSCSVVGDLEIRPFTSKIFHNTRMLRVWLPPGYKNPEHRNQRYPVLYLNDGQDLFDACTSIFNPQEWRADETATELIQSGKIPPLILVGIDNAGKHDRPKEYLPYPDETLRPATPDVHGKDYPSFLLNEVMPFINREYRTDPDPTKTGLGGSSYGAGIALYTVITHPGHFGKLLLESPSIYAGNYGILRHADRTHPWPKKIFLGVGTVNEPIEDVQKLRTLFQSFGLGDDVVRVIQQPGAAHNENAWASRFPQALQFLYGTTSGSISSSTNR